MQRSDIPRILVCGGRDYADYLSLNNVLSRVVQERGWLWDKEYSMPCCIIISGAAKGADTLAIDWAVVNWCEFESYPADWKTHGRKAGPIRNRQMLVEGKPDLVVAFPGGVGTRDMIRQSKKAGVEVIEIN